MRAVSALALFLALIGAAVVICLKGKSEISVDSFVQYLLFGLVFVLFLSTMQFTWASTRASDWVNRIGRFCSGFSFTLCVLHIPLIAAFLHIAAPVLGSGKLDANEPLDLLLYLLLYLGLVVGAYLFHLPFDARTYQVAEWLKTTLRFQSRPVRA